MKSRFLISAICLSSLAAVIPANAAPFTFSTGNPDGLMAAASRPGGNFEIETGDDFALTNPTSITSATFTGLIPTGAPLSNIQSVTVQIYQVFPADSDVSRTSGPPTFSTANVPTRVNSPSDVQLMSASSPSGLTFTATLLQSMFTAANSVAPGGIIPKPGQTTGGNAQVTGEEIQFSLNLITALSLGAGHYFFVPQVQLSTGDFFWLSAPRPIVPPGTPFPAGFTDLQGWTRDGSVGGIDPDWLRIGTDIVGGTTPPTFNFAFSLSGDVVPIPPALPLFATGLAGLGLLGWRRKKAAAS
jgi:hypothetical protein